MGDLRQDRSGLSQRRPCPQSRRVAGGTIHETQGHDADSNLNIRKGPGTDQPIIGKAAHNSIVTLLSKYNSEWALVRSDKNEEGYCSLKYLTPI